MRFNAIYINGISIRLCLPIQYTHDTHTIPGDNSFNYEDIYLTVFVQIKLCYKTRFIWCFSVESRAIKLIAKSESVFPSILYQNVG